MTAVQPDVAVHIDAVKYDLDLAVDAYVGRETLAIPACASHKPASVALALAQVHVKRTDPARHHRISPNRSLTCRFGQGRESFHAPIVGQVEQPPGAVVKFRVFGPRDISPIKPPASVKQLIACVFDKCYITRNRLTRRAVCSHLV